ncbi:nucleoside/nucleotide kinase family protein [Curtobacterium sp. MCPF17_002]|uniref:nucleoside/nucleotide kinase family protein n=1 Tax=Curtobacterium sp. MCPF17_002 TaxID=2175645 RepID=UPI0021AC2384|nr:nucleoside/nucleotide kinase family protein [Curtobacterium sp. MCPF17_002]WIB77601.1 nucleoside/nucleotide kinase family protein [Curtobacterium sp. MCPF17_002]
MTPHEMSVDEAVDRAVELATGGRRTVLGIVGAPGAGKSTLARRIVVAVDDALGSGTAVQVPMDGFHLSNAALDALGRHDRKGAIDTFDADGYVALVRRLVGAGEPDQADGHGPVVWAPDFDRRVDEPVAGSIPVPPSTRLVVSEGNYLLDDSAPWATLRDLVTETWFCTVDETVRVDRLVGRHMRHGRDHEAARRWAVEVDGVNAARVAPTVIRASRTVRT